MLVNKLLTKGLMIMKKLYLSIILTFFVFGNAFGNELKCVLSKGQLMGVSDLGEFVDGSLKSAEIIIKNKPGEPIQINDDGKLYMSLKEKKINNFTRWTFKQDAMLSLYDKPNDEGFREAIFINFHPTSSFGMMRYYKCFNL
tara:strand:- start:57 stop:482 length:426 start_codon:yes stop_codon:yes gene_type:complete